VSDHDINREGLGDALEAINEQRLPDVLDTLYFRNTGQRLDITNPGAWDLNGLDRETGQQVITSEDGPIDDTTRRMLARTYPNVRKWQARPAKIDETYREKGNMVRRVCQLLGVTQHQADAVLTIAASEEFGFRFAHARFEVTGDDDEQSWRIRTVEPESRFDRLAGLTADRSPAELEQDRRDAWRQ